MQKAIKVPTTGGDEAPFRRLPFETTRAHQDLCKDRQSPDDWLLAQTSDQSGKGSAILVKASGSHLDSSRVPCVLYGVKCIDPVTLAILMKAQLLCDEYGSKTTYTRVKSALLQQFGAGDFAKQKDAIVAGSLC